MNIIVALEVPRAKCKPQMNLQPMIDRNGNPVRSSAAQQRIRKAALELFAEKGAASVTISELAAAAGVVRGTIYKNVTSPELLFETIAEQLSDEMTRQVVKSYASVDDPAARLAIAIRLYVRRAHDEPHWGRFLIRFSMTNPSLRMFWSGPPAHDLALGVQSGRYDLKAEQLPSALAMIAGSTLGAIVLVLDGMRTWRDAGTEVATMVLRALGLSKEQAEEISARSLPDLAEP